MKNALLAAVAVTCFGILGGASAAPITTGNLVVVVAGDGAAALGTGAAAATMREYTIGGTLVQNIAMPTAASGAQGALTLAGSSTSEGFLKLSSNGQYLTMAGYNASPGTATIATSLASAFSRVVGRVDLAGNIDTSTQFTDAYNGSNIRGAVTTDGTTIYTSGNRAGSLDNGGVRYTTFGATSGSVRVNSGGTNRRVVDVYNGRLYASANSAPFIAVSSMVSALPTVSETETTLAGLPVTGTRSNYDFWFKDSNTLYIADDGSAANGAGIQKWTFDGANWVAASYILLNNGTSASLVRGLTGYVDGSGNAVLFGTTGSTIVSVTDAGVDNDTATIVATAGTNTAFRGIAFVPVVPEPGSIGVLALASVGFLRRRRA